MCDLTEQDLAVLNEQQRVVLGLRHGLSNDHPGCHTTAEISKLLGVCRSRVNQIQNQAERVLQLWRSGQLPADPKLIGPYPGDSASWTRICYALRRGGFTTWDQVAGLSTRDSAEIVNIGAKSVAAIAEHLDRLGLKHKLDISEISPRTRDHSHLRPWS